MAVKAVKPSPPTKRFVKKIGSKTINAAPINEPTTLPSPPIITMNKILNDRLMSKASDSAVPDQALKYKAPAIPIKNELTAKAFNLVASGLMPIISAAISILIKSV